LGPDRSQRQKKDYKCQSKNQDSDAGHGKRKRGRKQQARGKKKLADSFPKSVGVSGYQNKTRDFVITKYTLTPKMGHRHKLKRRKSADAMRGKKKKKKNEKESAVT